MGPGKPISTRYLNNLYALLAGDVITLALVTAAGFVTHREIGAPIWPILATFLPLLFSWLVAGLPLGVYTPSYFKSARQLWRPGYAMLLAGPLAALLRSVMLGQAVVITTFAFVVAGLSTAAILAWRALVVVINNWKA